MSNWNQSISNSRFWSGIGWLQFTSVLENIAYKNPYLCVFVFGWKGKSFGSVCICMHFMLFVLFGCFWLKFKQNLMVINDVHFPFETVARLFVCSHIFGCTSFFAIVIAVIMIIEQIVINDECVCSVYNLWICTTHSLTHHMLCHFQRKKGTHSKIHFLKSNFNGFAFAIKEHYAFPFPFLFNASTWHCLPFFILLMIDSKFCRSKAFKVKWNWKHS